MKWNGLKHEKDESLSVFFFLALFSVVGSVTKHQTLQKNKENKIPNWSGLNVRDSTDTYLTVTCSQNIPFIFVRLTKLNWFYSPTSQEWNSEIRKKKKSFWKFRERNDIPSSAEESEKTKKKARNSSVMAELQAKRDLFLIIEVHFQIKKRWSFSCNSRGTRTFFCTKEWEI